MSNDDQSKLDGQRAAIREHIEKYSTYPDEWDKNFALKTIRNAQGQVASLLKKHSHWNTSWEDNWAPPK